MLKNKYARLAGLTMEVAVASLMAITVLFLTLGLFSDNLKVMAESGNIKNLFQRNSSLTLNNNFAKDYNSKNSQVNVQIVGEQGVTIEYYMTQAENAIKAITDKYADPANISDEDLKALAKNITMLKIGNKLAGDSLSIAQKYISKGKISQIASLSSPRILIKESNGNQAALTIEIPENDPLTIVSQLYENNNWD